MHVLAVRLLYNRRHRNKAGKEKCHSNRRFLREKTDKTVATTNMRGVCDLFTWLHREISTISSFLYMNKNEQERNSICESKKRTKREERH